MGRQLCRKIFWNDEREKTKAKKTQWNLSKENLCRKSFCIRNRQVLALYRLNWQRFPTLGLYFKFGLYRILFHSGFSLDRFIQDSVSFRVQFRQVYTSGFSLDRFIQDSVSFRVQFRQVSLYKQNTKSSRDKS